MKKIRVITEEITKKEIEDIFCNLCGKSLSPDRNSDILKREYYGLVEATVSGGFFSSHLEDGQVYTFSLCESCLYDLFCKFKYPCETNNYLFNDGNSLKYYSEKELQNLLEEINSKSSKSVEDFKMMDEIEQELIERG
jgi:hypothetical protein